MLYMSQLALIKTHVHIKLKLSAYTIVALNNLVTQLAERLQKGDQTCNLTHFDNIDINGAYFQSTHM